MTTTMIVLLCIDAVLLVSLIAYAVVALLKREEASAACTCTCCEPEPEAEKEEEVATAEVEPEPVVEPVVEPEPEPEPVVEEEPVVAEPEPVAEPVVEPVAEPVVETIVVGGSDDASKRIPFAHKMLFMDKKTQSFYDALNNAFKGMRKINIRVSTKGVSYRLGRDLVAKITVRGKTMKLHLALNVNNFDEKIYFQKDLSAVKAYADVPCTVKVKSERGLKNALKLVDALAETHGIEKKTRFIPIDSIEALKEIANKR